jgi:uncharacterized membrane protein YbhN (UPF0104 family)
LARFAPRALHGADVRIFSSASHAPRARRPTDIVLLILATLSVVALSFAAPGPAAIESSFTKFVTELPGLFGWFWELSFDLLLGWALFLLVASLVAHARKGLLLDIVLAGVLAYGLAAVVGKIVGTDWSTSFKSIAASDPPAIYPCVRIAVATAMIVTASPHLARPLRYVGRWVIFFGALAGIAVGVALPVGIAGGFAVGVGAAAIVHLLVGSPGGRLTLDQVARALRDLGVDAADLRHAPLQPSGVALVEAAAPGGRSLLVKVYGRDSWDGQLLASVWSSLWHRGETPTLGSSRLQQVEHEAFVTLLAEREGVSVLPVVAAGMAAERDALLVLDTTGRPLSSLDPMELDDALLGKVWGELGRLHAAGISHGNVDDHRIVVRPDATIALGDLADAAVAAEEPDFLADRAQLLVATALLAGHERAVAAAGAALGAPGLADVIPFLQTAVLARVSRQAVREREWDLDDLRDLAAHTAGVQPPELEKIRRVTWGSVLTMVLIVVVAYVIISAVAEVGLQSLIDEFKEADGAWLWAAVLLSPTVQVAQAFSTIGASSIPVRFGPVLMLQYAVQFIALAVPSSAARVALEIRFFEKVGVNASGAVAIGVIDSVCGFVVQILLILVITVSGLASLDLPSSGGSSHSFSGKILIVAGVGLLIAVVVAIAVPRFRAIVRDKAADGRAALRVLHSPSKVALIFLGNLVAQIILAVILGLSLRAFGYRLTLADMILVNTAVSLFAGFMPVPGGMGVAEAGYTAGFVALGVPHSAAVSAALAFRMATYYLPPIWGGFAMRWLRQHSYV